jgi:hypothetical protein
MKFNDVCVRNEEIAALQYFTAKKDEYIARLKKIQEEAVLSIHAGDNTRFIYYKLNSFTDIPFKEDEVLKRLEESIGKNDLTICHSYDTIILKEREMTDIIQHTVNYSLDELKELVNSPMDNKLFQKIKRYMHLITYSKALPGEVFRKYPLSSSLAALECSNFGRIRLNGDICKPVEEKPGWLYVYFDKQKYPVYRIIAETWCVCPSENLSGWEVHHITNDGYDNTPANLIWIKGDAHKKIGTPREPKMKITFDEDEDEIKRIIEEINS